MSDPLLDEATRLADTGEREGMVVAPTRVLRALVERVQQAEQEADKFRNLWDRHGKNDLIAERDEALAKLDAVYDVGTDWRDLRRLRSILDGSSPDA